MSPLLSTLIFLFVSSSSPSHADAFCLPPARIPPRRCVASISSSSSSAIVAPDSDDDQSATTTARAVTTSTTKRNERIARIREEGGILAFDTKYGALNPFAIYYGLVSIGLGVVWFVALSICELAYKITGDRIDGKRRIPVFLSHVWGTLLMMFTGCTPRVENGNIIRDFHKR